MKTITLSLCMCIAALSAMAERQNLPGFSYGTASTPTGKEWQSPESLSLNKEQPHAYFFSFSSVEKALQVLPEHSDYYQSLNGTWKFHWAATPEERPTNFYEANFDASIWDNIEVPSCWNVVGVQKDGTQKYGVPIYVNQPVIFMHSVKEGDWKEGVMRTPPSSWTTYKYRNEVGSYRRTFTVPRNWDGREVYINFDGIDSFFYLWINGQYVGFSKNSRNTAQFNISRHLKKGENVVAVEVYRNSDGSFLEAQDMFRLPGIFRSTYLSSTPKTQIRDLAVRTTLNDRQSSFQTGSQVIVDAEIRNLNTKSIKDYKMTYSVYPVKLYSDEIEGRCVQQATSAPFSIEKNGTNEGKTVFAVSNPRLWSSEAPYRYVLIAELKDKKNNVVDRISTYFGIREVEIRQTDAADDEFGKTGRYFYVNNMPVKLKGVNRHETSPETGHAISHKQMEHEVMLMRQGNINHVRNSHYSNDPYWYYLCNKYGIYLEDESNIESHEYYYGDASLSHPVEWQAAHVARNMELVRAHVNHPSIVIWSLGNEAGPGKNFEAAYKAIKQYDTSRPVQYERNNDIVDMGSNQYPSVDWVKGAATGNWHIKYPFHISEYAHSMGNAVGDLAQIWEGIESSNFICGGAIWDWVDQAINNYTPDGRHYYGYGGDFGDTPNDGMFCMNGIMLPNLSPKPAYYEVKKVYQNISVKAIDMKAGKIEVMNKAYFTSLSDYNMEWQLYKDGVKVSQSNVFVGGKNILGARQKQVYTLPYDYASLSPESEYFVKVQFLLATDKPWAKKGYVQMEEQLPVKKAEKWNTLAEENAGKKSPSLTKGKDIQTVKGNDWEVTFNNATGTIHTLTYGGKQIITAGNGPVLDALRAPVDNDNWFYTQWYHNGLHNLKHHALSSNIYTRHDGAIVLSYTVESQAPCAGQIQGGSSGRLKITDGNAFGPDDFKFTTNQIWTVYADGSIELESSIISNNESLTLPRLGYVMKTPSTFCNYTYYGRGPVNNYNDRCTSQNIELYKSSVKEQFVAFPKPQSMGNREDVRWCALTDASGTGAQFIATQRMSTSCLPWSAMQLTTAAHPCDLPQSDGNYLHLDLKVTGLGGTSCGQAPPLAEDRIKADAHQMGFIIRPASADMQSTAHVRASGEMPITISRDKVGKLTISSPIKGAEILYTITPLGTSRVTVAKPQTYRSTVNMRSGGMVTAWYKNNPQLKATMHYAAIENIPLEVVYASCEEPKGDFARNMVDGNPETIWHTTYSVTVAKYPHWVDFDCGEVKLLKGFTYLPRQNGSNGRIKGYKVQLSIDGKKWSNAVAEGEFPNGTKEQKILFNTPTKARYVRFTALSSQDGQDFASCAEFGVLAEQ